MSTEKLNKFLKALDAVKEDYTCGFCLQLCKKPITLSSCYHIICADHKDLLKNCPTCKKPLEGCNVFSDSRLESCINSTKELDTMFLELRSSNISEEAKKVNAGAFASKRRGKLESPLNTSHDSKENKHAKNTPTSNNPNSTVVSNRSNKRSLNAEINLNTTMTSNTSFNKGIEKRNVKGETLLHVACRLGKVDTVTDLLKQGANTNTKDNAGWTPLHEAAQNGRLDLVKILLQYNTLIDVPGQSNETPLHEAVRFNHNEIAKELVQNGANINARNCKGETPLQLANVDMKKVLETASDNILQTQGVNISYISELYTEIDQDEIRIYYGLHYRTVHNKIKLLSKHHSNVHSESKFTKKVTHLIVDTEDDYICTSSLDVLQGIVSGIWIISSQWITKSSEDKLELFKDYEITGVGSSIFNGPKIARYNKYKQLPGIFNGCHFYLHNFHTKYEISKSIVLTKAILTKLIVDAGGIVLRRVPNPESIPDAEKLVPYHAKNGSKLMNCSHYIIFKDVYEPMYNMQHIKALPVGWLIECIQKYELCDP